MDEGLEDFGGKCPGCFFRSGIILIRDGIGFLIILFLKLCSQRRQRDRSGRIRAFFLKVFDDFLKNAAFSGTIDT